MHPCLLEVECFKVMYVYVCTYVSGCKIELYQFCPEIYFCMQVCVYIYAGVYVHNSLILKQLRKTYSAIMLHWHCHYMYMISKL